MPTRHPSPTTDTRTPALQRTGQPTAPVLEFTCSDGVVIRFISTPQEVSNRIHQVACDLEKRKSNPVVVENEPANAPCRVAPAPSVPLVAVDGDGGGVVVVGQGKRSKKRSYNKLTPEIKS
jgi:hypothetical protein